MTSTGIEIFVDSDKLILRCCCETMTDTTKPTLYVASLNPIKREAVSRIASKLSIEFEPDIVSIDASGSIDQPVGVEEATLCLLERTEIALTSMAKPGLCIIAENYVEYLKGGQPANWRKDRLPPAYSTETDGWVDRCAIAICSYKINGKSKHCNKFVPSDLVVPIPSSQLADLHTRAQLMAENRMAAPTIGRLLQDEHDEESIDAADWFFLVESCKFTRCDQIVNAIERNIDQINQFLS